MFRCWVSPPPSFLDREKCTSQASLSGTLRALFPQSKECISAMGKKRVPYDGAPCERVCTVIFSYFPVCAAQFQKNNPSEGLCARPKSFLTDPPVVQKSERRYFSSLNCQCAVVFVQLFTDLARESYKHLSHPLLHNAFQNVRKVHAG